MIGERRYNPLAQGSPVGYKVAPLAAEMKISSSAPPVRTVRENLCISENVAGLTSGTLDRDDDAIVEYSEHTILPLL